MSLTPSTNPPRPLSPHLSIYKPQLTSMMSILHRITGTALAAGFPIFVFWLMALAHGSDSYAAVNSVVGSSVGLLVLSGWCFALFYHMGNGVRHLFWDSGRLLSLKSAYRAGYAVITFSILASLIVLGFLPLRFDFSDQLINYVVTLCVLLCVPLSYVVLVILWRIISCFIPTPKTARSFRSKLADVRGLGSAHHGTRHWWAQRVSAILLVPLFVLTLFSFLELVAMGDYHTARQWLHSPFGVLVIMLLIISLYHAYLGLEVIVEDYVHNSYAQLAHRLTLQSFFFLLGILGTLAVLRVQLSEIVPHV